MSRGFITLLGVKMPKDLLCLVSELLCHSSDGSRYSKSDRVHVVHANLDGELSLLVHQNPHKGIELSPMT